MSPINCGSTTSQYIISNVNKCRSTWDMVELCPRAPVNSLLFSLDSSIKPNWLLSLIIVLTSVCVFVGVVSV